jgi:hypothetical protein
MKEIGIGFNAWKWRKNQVGFAGIDIFFVLGIRIFRNLSNSRWKPSRSNRNKFWFTGLVYLVVPAIEEE